MDKKLKIFILCKLKSLRKTQRHKLLFLRALKRDSEVLKKHISENISSWTQEYADKLYRVVLLANEQQAVSEIIESLKKSFAKELAKIP